MRGLPLRWVAIAIFVLSSSLNYLDRQLVPALAETLKAEFHLTNQNFASLLAGFSLLYAMSAPLAGLFIDRVGLNKGMSIAVGCWSLAGMSTALAGSLPGLIAARAALGIAEAGGLPGNGKANASYLESRELALGTALNQVGISVGSFAAPLLVGYLAVPYGWRTLFFFCGMLGFVWIPVWLYTARRIPQKPRPGIVRHPSTSGMLRDRRFWALVIASILYMTLYALWTSWTTVYFVHERGMTAERANREFAWLLPLFMALGAFTGGAAAYRLIRGGMNAVRARLRVCLVSAVLLLLTAAIPYMPTTALATSAVCLSAFCVSVMSTNVYAMPIDVFGAGRAAFGIGALTCAYGVMQALISRPIGWMVDNHRFAEVLYVLAPLPLIAIALLWWVLNHDCAPGD